MYDHVEFDPAPHLAGKFTTTDEADPFIEYNIALTKTMPRMTDMKDLPAEWTLFGVTKWRANIAVCNSSMYIEVARMYTRLTGLPVELLPRPRENLPSNNKGEFV